MKYRPPCIPLLHPALASPSCVPLLRPLLRVPAVRSLLTLLPTECVVSILTQAVSLLSNIAANFLPIE